MMKHENCQSMLSMLSDFIDGELKDEFCVELENHLSECPDCSIVVDTLKKTISLYKENASEPLHVPNDVRERLFKCLNLEEFIADMVLEPPNTSSENVMNAGLSHEDKLTISTIHSAKGLEFKVVFVVALEENILPHGRSFDLKDAAKHDEGIEEERRLMYVAMTRASDFLYLTAALTRRGEAAVESRFLDEIPEEYLAR